MTAALVAVAAAPVATVLPISPKLQVVEHQAKRRYRLIMVQVIR